MLRGHTAKDPKHRARMHWPRGIGFLYAFIRILPQLTSLGRIRTGKRYGALAFRKEPAKPDVLRGLVTQTPPTDQLAAAMRIPIAIGLCPHGTTPLVNFVIIRPGPYNA